MGNNLRNAALAFSILSLIIISGCQLTDEQIKARVIKQNSELDSYKTNVDMKISADTQLLGSRIDLMFNIGLDGGIDKKNRKAALKQTLSTDIAGRTITYSYDVYMIDDYKYLKTAKGWQKEKIDESLWLGTDYARKIALLIENSQIQRLGDQTINDRNYYVFRVLPDKTKLLELIDDNAGLEYTDFDVNNIKNYTITAWVEKRSFYIEKYNVYMLIEPESRIVGSGKLTFDIDVSISDINKEVMVNLPDEARNAAEVDELEIFDFDLPD